MNIKKNNDIKMHFTGNNSAKAVEPSLLGSYQSRLEKTLITMQERAAGDGRSDLVGLFHL